MKRLSRFIVLSFLAVSFFLAPGLTGAADAAKVAVTVEKLTLGEGFIVEPTIVPISSGQSAAEVIKSLLENKFPTANPAYSASGGSGGAFYLKGIYDPAIGKLLSEFDKGNKSGWMVTVANTFIGTSAGSRILADGEVMRWQYTTQLGAEFGVGADNLGGNKLANKDALVKKVAEINAEGNKADYGSAYTNAVSVLTTLAAAQAQVDSALSALNNPTPTPDPTPTPKPEPTPTPTPEPSPTPDPTPSPVTPPVTPPPGLELAAASTPEEIKATWETYVTTNKTSGAVSVIIEIPAPAGFVFDSSSIKADASGFTSFSVTFRAAQASGASVSSLSAAGGTLRFSGTCANEAAYKSAKLNGITYEVGGTPYKQTFGENGSGVTIASDTKIVNTEEINGTGTGTGGNGGSESGGGSGSGGGGGGCDAGLAGIFAVLAAAMIARKKR